MEVGAIRRDLGQLILATAILDDTIAWVIIALIAGIAAHGAWTWPMSAPVWPVLLCFGDEPYRRAARSGAHHRWCNDTLTMEVPVITAILLVMLVMALTTEAMGVHTALGAFGGRHVGRPVAHPDRAHRE